MARTVTGLPQILQQDPLPEAHPNKRLPVKRLCYICKGPLLPEKNSSYGGLRFWYCPEDGAKVQWSDSAGTMDIFGEPVFKYNADGNKTHRWHWGRMEWIERG